MISEVDYHLETNRSPMEGYVFGPQLKQVVLNGS